MKVIFSPVVQNVLDNLYLKDSLKGKEPKFYNECFDALLKLDGTSNIITTTPKCWNGGRVFCLLTALFPDLFALDPHACNIGGNGIMTATCTACLRLTFCLSFLII